jgi:transcriptional regulator with XRE-family HTH domain
MTIGTKIRNLRYENNKMSQEELAYKVGIAQTSISNIEADKSIPDFLLMEKICNIFDVCFDYFLEKNVEYRSFNKNETKNIVDGKIEALESTMSEGILENVIKRLDKLETIIKDSRIKFTFFCTYMSIVDSSATAILF